VFYRGDPAAAIIAHARAHAADLVVVGRRPYRLLRRYGASVAKAVARAAVCPVLIGPGDVDRAKRNGAPHFNEIVCAVDFSAASATALRYAVRLVNESGGRLHPVHVLDRLPNEFIVGGGRAYRFLQEYNAIRNKAATQLRDAIPRDALNWCEVQDRVVGGIPSREIVKVADDVDADLIVLGVRPRGVAGEVIVGATLSALLRHATCPVLTVPASEDVLQWPATGDETAGTAARSEHESEAFL
jgi:nucleotide-binding universal stress UspA family protein